MKRLAVLLAFVLLCALPVAVAQEGGAPTPDVRVIEWNPETGELRLGITFPATATATPTPAPPTAPPSPTHTSQPPTVTPTPETGITPAPTVERVCEAQVQGDYHRVRADRSTSAVIISSMPPSSWMRVDRIVRNSEGEWLYGTGTNANGTPITGWALVTENLELQDSQACWALPFEDEIDPLPTIAPTATPQTVTPVPTGPAPGACTYRHTFAMTMRDGPGTSYPRIGTLPANTPVIVGHIYPDTVAERWAFITYEGVTGWVAVRAGGVTYGALSGDCGSVPRYPPRVEALGVGWTTTFGYDAALYEAGESLRGKGYAPSIVLTSNSGESCAWAARDWRVLVRPWYQLGLGDDPDLSLAPEASARQRVQQLEGYVRLLCADSDNVTVQLSNETSFPSAAYLNRWILAACAECEARGWTCAPVMFSVGTPELDWFPTLRPALARMTESGAYLGYNAYGYARDAMLCDPTALYTVWRVRLMRVAAGEPFPRVWVSEAARGAGDVPPIVSDAACFVRASMGVHDVVALWYAGGDSAWGGARWTAGTMRELARAL